MEANRYDAMSYAMDEKSTAEAKLNIDTHRKRKELSGDASE